MASIVWTETALNDMNGIAEYISLDSAFYAKQFVAKIFLAVNKLEKYPELGKQIRELSKFSYKEILFKKYRIIYRLQADTIYIITVHHSSRLLENSEYYSSLYDDDL